MTTPAEQHLDVDHKRRVPDVLSGGLMPILGRFGFVGWSK